MRFRSTVCALLVVPLVSSTAYAGHLQARSGGDPQLLSNALAEEIITGRSVDAEAGQRVRSRVLRGLDDREVSRALADSGVTKSEFRLRLAGMTDRELAQVERDAQNRQAGGDVVVISTTVLLLVIIILLLI